MADEERWALRFEATTANRRVIEAVTTMSAGTVAWRGLPLGADDRDGDAPLAAGVFDDSPVPKLLDGPPASWVIGDGRVGAPQHVTLDLYRGMVISVTWSDRCPTTMTQFASSAHPGLHIAEVEGPVDGSDDLASLLSPSGSGVASSERGAIGCRAVCTTTNRPESVQVVRMTATACHPTETDEVEVTATRRLDAVQARSADVLRAEHEAVWAERWRLAANDLPEQLVIERRLRFAQYHLWCSSGDGDEAAIGARGATGRAYRGHVFWDTDVFVVPALAAFAPERARAALRYRWNRLRAAKSRAHAEGRSGARFPWESADSGVEVAPTQGVDLHGQTVPIKTGAQEEHITADIAWSVLRYLEWTDDETMAAGPASDILAETARYWHSRIEIDSDGSGHLRGVIGPDEYHETVDDNAFTNVMARWNLRRSADFCEARGAASPAECRSWRATADRLVDGFDRSTGVHEQFDGFFALDPITMSGLGRPPLAADALLGHERINDVQIIKQPDVLMLHHLVPGELASSFEHDLDFYLPRTAHGSSLSPAITASLLARAGRLDEARHWFDIALGMDLDDLSKTTAGGLHLATMGGVYQAYSQGFLGVVPTGGVLQIDPHVPEEWGTVTHRFLYRSIPIHLVASCEHLSLSCPVPIEVAVGSDGPHRVSELTARRHANEWKIR